LTNAQSLQVQGYACKANRRQRSHTPPSRDLTTKMRSTKHVILVSYKPTNALYASIVKVSINLKQVTNITGYAKKTTPEQIKPGRLFMLRIILLVEYSEL